MIENAYATASVDFSIERTVSGYETFFSSLLAGEHQLVPSTV